MIKMGKISLFMSFPFNKAVGGLSIPPDTVTVANSRSPLLGIKYGLQYEIRCALFLCVQFVSLVLAVFCSLVAIAAKSNCKYVYNAAV